jgi:hypothetical protein
MDILDARHRQNKTMCFTDAWTKKSSQAARVCQVADSSVGAPSEGETAAIYEYTHSELRAMIYYLRREKEIGYAARTLQAEEFPPENGDGTRHL